MLTDIWTGCYKRGWGAELVPEAFAHPAKISFSLAERIYAHILAEGWAVEGDTVMDPFGGISGTAYHALFAGLNWVGCELEEKFVALGNQNIALWNARYGGRFARWGTARLVQGDSRRLLDVVREAGIVVSSPPYEGSDNRGASIGINDDNWRKTRKNAGVMFGGYDTPDNLGNLRADEHGFAAAISSPPYAHDTISRDQRPGNPTFADRDYGQSDGQLGAMPAGDLAQVVSSPPYEGTQLSGGGGIANEMRQTYREGQNYGDTDSQMGALIGDSFWAAARVIVEQTYAALRPGGYSCWIVKSFVRNKQIVDFPGQWRQLCESVGFVTLHEHHASLVQDSGTQTAIDGNHKHHKKERKSFFRRLSEFNARAAAFWATLDRAVQAEFIRIARADIWQRYREDLLNPKLDRHGELIEPPYPTSSRIRHQAKAAAYRGAGEPTIEYGTRIDHETVYCMTKRDS